MVKSLNYFSLTKGVINSVLGVVGKNEKKIFFFFGRMESTMNMVKRSVTTHVSVLALKE